MKIHHSINLTHIITLIILTVLLVGAVNFTVKGVFEDEINEGEFAVAVHVASELTDPLLNDDFAEVQQFIDHEKKQPPLDIKYVYVIDGDGVVLAHTFPELFPHELATANPVPPEENDSIRTVSLEGESITDIGIRIPDVADTSVHIGFSREPIFHVINTLNSQILGMIIVILLLSFFVSFFVTRTITRPIELLVEGTKKIGEGKFDHRIDVKGPDEIEVLAKSINQMTEDLKTSEAKYCIVANSVDELIFLVDRNLCFLTCNRKTLECMKIATGDIAGKPLVEIITEPDDKEFYQIKLQRILENGKPETHEREVTISGEKRYYNMTMAPVFDAEGNVTAIACVGCDITERKRIEKELQESEERYRKLVDMASDSIIVHREGRLVFANPATAKLMGAKDKEEMIGKSVLDFIPPEDRELIIEHIRHILDTHEPVLHLEQKLIRMDGSTIDAVVTGSFITYDGEPAIQTIVHDITERKRALDEVLSKHAQLLSIFDSIDEIVYVADPDTYELLYFNEAFRSRFGGNVGDKCYMVLQKEPSACSFCSNKYIFGENLGKTYVWEWQNLVDRHWYRCIDRAIEWPDGRMVRYEMAIDVSELKLAEEKLHNAHQQLLDIIEFLPDATFVIDAEKKVIAWNRAIEEMTGLKKEDMIGKGDYAYAVPFYDERRPILIDLVLDFDRDIEEKYDFVERIGNTLLVEVFVPLVYGGKGAYLWAAASPLFDSSGKLIGAIETIRNITERKQTENELRAAHQKLKDIIEFLPDATFVIDAEKKVIAWNRAIEEMSGVKKEDIIGKGDYAYTIPFYGERRESLIDLVFMPDSEIKQKYTNIEKIGDSIYGEAFTPTAYGGKGAYLSGKASPLYDSSGKVIGAIETIRDITERKQIEEALREQKDFASDMVRYSATPTFVIDPQHKVLYWNIACENLTGVKESDVVGTDNQWKPGYDHKRPTLADMIINGQVDEYFEQYDVFGPSIYATNGLHAEKWFANMGGEERYLIFDATPIYNAAGELIAAVETIQDITRRKRAEEALRESEERYRNVVELATDAIIVHSEDGRIIFVNPAMITLVGAKDKEEVIGKSVLDIIPPDNRELTIEHIQYVVDKHEPLKGLEEKLMRLDGSVIDVYVTGTLIIYGGEPALLIVLHDITKRKRAEEALKESEERYRNVVELASDAIIVQSEGGRIIFANPAMATLFDAKDPEELIGKTVLDFIPPENRESTVKRMQKVLDKHEPLKRVEEKLIRMDGSLIDAEVTGSFITYAGKPAILSIAHDITERKRAEEDLLLKHKQLLSIFDSIDEIVYVADPDTYELLYFNEAFRSRFGGNVGDKCFEVIQDEPSPCSFCSNKYIFGDNLGKTYIWEWQNLRDRRWYRYIDRAIEWPDGRMVRYQMGIDITERKLVEEKIRESEEKYREMIEGLAEAVYRMSLPDGTYDYVSPAAKDVFGYIADDIIKNPLFVREIIHPDFIGYFEEKWDDLIHGKVPPIYEYKIIDPKGHERWIIQSNKGVFDNEGNIIAIEGICRDITKQKEAEIEIHKYAKELEHSNELKDLFTDILRHDLLNPASIVKGYTDVLLEIEENEQKLRSLYAIERNSKKLIDMIETASRFAKLESVEKLDFSEMDIKEILIGVIEDFRSRLEEKQMLLDFAAEGSYPSKVSPVIEEVFANLLSNAIKYSPEKSRIIIDIADAGEDWKVSVTDFGEGISDEDKSKLFERFKRMEKGAVKGTGLGLAIVKRLIILHGGTVGIEDNPAGQGSVFWVTVKKA